MILTKQQIRSIMQDKAKELRFPFTGEHFPEEGEGELAPCRSAPHREPACWVIIGESSIDEDTEEYVYRIKRVNPPDTPRLMMPGAKAGDGLGYTSSTYLAMRDEPEAVDAETVEEFTKYARERHRRHRLKLEANAQKQRCELSPDARLALALAAAAQNHVSIRDEVRIYRHYVRLGRTIVAAHQLELIERAAYREMAA